MEYEEEVDVPSDAAFFYEASSTGETKSRLAMFKAAVVTFGAFLAWAQGKGGPFVSLPLSIKDVTEKQWVTEGTYLQYLKWLVTRQTVKLGHSPERSEIMKFMKYSPSFSCVLAHYG